MATPTQTSTLDLQLPTRQELPRSIALLAVPVLLEQLLSFCVTFFDVFLSGRISTDATSAIGVSAYVSWLASMLSGLIGTGVAALVARAIGQGDREEAQRLTSRALMLAVTLGSLVMIGLWTCAEAFADLLGMKGATRAIAVEFLRYDAFGQLFACTTLVAAAALRGAGDMRTPLMVLGFTNIVNVVMSMSLVYGWGPFPALGVLGIVTGTVIAHFCAWCLMMITLFRGWSRLKIIWAEVTWDQGTTQRILRIGGPAALDGAVTFTGHFLFLMVIARLSPLGFDGATFAAHMVGIRAEAICYLPAAAWGAASASLAGRYLGAGQPDLALRTGHLAVFQYALYGLPAAIIMFATAPQIYAFMHHDPEVALIGVPALRWLAVYQLPTAVMIIYSMTLRGSGDTRFPLFCACFSILGVRVPVAWWGGIYMHAGLVGAWWGMGADNCLRMILMTWRYAAGRWRGVSL